MSVCDLTGQSRVKSIRVERVIHRLTGGHGAPLSNPNRYRPARRRAVPSVNHQKRAILYDDGGLSGGRVSGDALRGSGGGGHAAPLGDVAPARRTAAAEEQGARARREHHHRHAPQAGLRHLPVRRFQRGL